MSLYAQHYEHKNKKFYHQQKKYKLKQFNAANAPVESSKNKNIRNMTDSLLYSDELFLPLRAIKIHDMKNYGLASNELYQLILWSLITDFLVVSSNNIQHFTMS